MVHLLKLYLFSAAGGLRWISFHAALVAFPPLLLVFLTWSLNAFEGWKYQQFYHIFHKYCLKCQETSQIQPDITPVEITWRPQWRGGNKMRYCRKSCLLLILIKKRVWDEMKQNKGAAAEGEESLSELSQQTQFPRVLLCCSYSARWCTPLAPFFRRYKGPWEAH